MVDAQACFLNLCEQRPGGPNATDLLIFVVSLIATFAIIFAIAISVSRFLITRAKLGAPSITMVFRVGTNSEPHTVAIAYYQSVRAVRATVDGHSVINRSFTTGLKLTRTMEWTVGKNERHLVQLEKTRQRVYGQFKPQQFVASVDGIVVARAATMA
jgi:hypothetical protein